MRVLVTAASKHGSTDEIATAIAATLSESGLDVTVERPDEVSGLDGFDAIVLGSGVYAGHWLDPAKSLAERLRDQLAAKPVWLFSSGPIGDPPRPDEDPEDIPEISRLTWSRDHRTFPGRLDRNRLGFGEKAIVMALRAPEGDFRDWDEIRAWALDIAEDLQARAGAPS